MKEYAFVIIQERRYWCYRYEYIIFSPGWFDKLCKNAGIVIDENYWELKYVPFDILGENGFELKSTINYKVKGTSEYQSIINHMIDDFDCIEYIFQKEI